METIVKFKEPDMFKKKQRWDDLDEIVAIRRGQLLEFLERKQRRITEDRNKDKLGPEKKAANQLKSKGSSSRHGSRRK